MSELNANLFRPEHGWTCFHCGATFTTPGAARDHFGTTPKSVPGCIIKVGEERGLEMALRRVEDFAERAAKHLEASAHALRSYQFGNSATELAASMAFKCERAVEDYKVLCSNVKNLTE